MKNICKISTFIGGLLVFAALAGCNTMQGLGKDISAGGTALSNAADHVKNGGKNNQDNEKVKYNDVNDAAFQDNAAQDKK